ncbi:DUF3667 domain-containing protein [Mesonia mobilis]|uniref:DUF3667 domain-containing protein n=1 Tax=Mesonia mobilis TaxID=369791 RepID=UPI0034E8BCFD
MFLNYDNTFLKTYAHLFTQPHIVIGDYINGVRKKYLNVVSYITIALTLAGFYTKKLLSGNFRYFANSR